MKYQCMIFFQLSTKLKVSNKTKIKQKEVGEKMEEEKKELQENETHRQLYDEFIKDMARYIALTIFNERN